MENQCVLKDLKVFVYGGARHLGVIGHIGKVDDFAVTEGGYFEKPAEGWYVANDCFSHNLLLEVQTSICLKIRTGLIGKVDRRKQSPFQGTCQVESVLQFLVSKRMQGSRSGPPP